MKKLNRRERRAKAGISKKVGTFHKIPAGNEEVRITWTPDAEPLINRLYGSGICLGSGYLPWYKGPRD